MRAAHIRKNRERLFHHVTGKFLSVCLALSVKVINAIDWRNNIMDFTRQEMLELWLKRQGLTKADLARKMETSLQNVCKIMKAETIPPWRYDQLVKLGIPESYPQNKPSKGTKNISDSIIHFSLPFNLIFYCFFDSSLSMFKFFPACEPGASVGNGAPSFVSSRKESFSSSALHLSYNSAFCLDNLRLKDISSDNSAFKR